MKLLSSEEVKNEKDKKTEEQLDRVSKLRDEETSLVKKVNDARSQADIDIEKINQEVLEYKKSAEQTKINLDVEIISKNKEIEILENRRRESLKPIELIQKEAESKLESAEKKEIELSEKESLLNDKNDDLVELSQDLADRDGDIKIKENNLNERESKIIKEEERLKISAESLSKKWVEYHKSVNFQNAEMIAREKDVENTKIANNKFRESLEAEDLRLKEKDRQVQDKYIALAQAKKHLGIPD